MPSSRRMCAQRDDNRQGCRVPCLSATPQATLPMTTQSQLVGQGMMRPLGALHRLSQLRGPAGPSCAPMTIPRSRSSFISHRAPGTMHPSQADRTPESCPCVATPWDAHGSTVAFLEQLQMAHAGRRVLTWFMGPPQAMEQAPGPTTCPALLISGIALFL